MGSRWELDRETISARDIPTSNIPFPDPFQPRRYPKNVTDNPLTSLLIQAVSSPDSANPTAALKPAPPAPITIALCPQFYFSYVLSFPYGTIHPFLHPKRRGKEIDILIMMIHNRISSLQPQSQYTTPTARQSFPPTIPRNQRPVPYSRQRQRQR